MRVYGYRRTTRKASAAVDDDRQITDWALAAGRGDQAAAAAFVRATRPEVVRFLACLAGPGDAEDLAQETFLRALRRLPQFAARSSAAHHPAPCRAGADRLLDLGGTPGRTSGDSSRGGRGLSRRERLADRAEADAQLGQRPADHDRDRQADEQDRGAGAARRPAPAPPGSGAARPPYGGSSATNCPTPRAWRAPPT